MLGITPDRSSDSKNENTSAKSKNQAHRENTPISFAGSLDVDNTADMPPADLKDTAAFETASHDDANPTTCNIKVNVAGEPNPVAISTGSNAPDHVRHTHEKNQGNCEDGGYTKLDDGETSRDEIHPTRRSGQASSRFRSILKVGSSKRNKRGGTLLRSKKSYAAC